MSIYAMYSQAQGFYEPEISLPPWGEEEEEDYLKRLGCNPTDIHSRTTHGDSGGTYFTMYVAEGKPWTHVFEIWDIDQAIAYVGVANKGDALSLRLKLMAGLTVSDDLQVIRDDLQVIRDDMQEIKLLLERLCRQ
jgi:hypothetical protein